MGRWIGGTKNYESGIGGERLIEQLLDDPVQFGLYFVALLVTLVILRMIYVWMFIIRPRKPKTDADWRPDCKFQGEAIFDGSQITFKNVRNFLWRTTKDFDEDWVDEITVDSEEIKDIWFIVDHFHSIKGLAHTFVTIEFNDGICLSFSFETRRVIGQRFHPWDGLWRAYELYLLVGLESDVMGLRTNGRKNIDYMFRAITPPGKDKKMLYGLAQRLNKLGESPEFYNSILTSCNTSIVSLVNKVTPGRIPFTWRNFFPGYTPRAAFKLGLIEDLGGFEQTMEKARIDLVAQEWDGEGSYSEMLREHLP